MWLFQELRVGGPGRGPSLPLPASSPQSPALSPRTDTWARDAQPGRGHAASRREPRCAASFGDGCGLWLRCSPLFFAEELTYVAKDSFWSYLSTVKSLFWEFFETALNMCKDAVSNKKLMTKLQESRFDILIADAVGPCGELLAELLKIPFVYSHYTSPGHIIEKNSGRLPFPPSYVPVMFAELSDRMTFMERIKNMLYTLYFELFFPTYREKKWNQFYSEVLGKLGFLIAQL